MRSSLKEGILELPSHHQHNLQIPALGFHKTDQYLWTYICATISFMSVSPLKNKSCEGSLWQCYSPTCLGNEHNIYYLDFVSHFFVEWNNKHYIPGTRNSLLSDTWLHIGLCYLKVDLVIVKYVYIANSRANYKNF